MTIESLEPLVLLAPVFPTYGLDDALLRDDVSLSPAVGSIDPTSMQLAAASAQMRGTFLASAGAMSFSIAPDSGRSASDGLTNGQRLTIFGTTETLSTVEVCRDGATLGTATAETGGTWSFDYTGTKLADGNYTFSATSTDAAGNLIAGPVEIPVTIDTEPPVSRVGSLPEITRTTNFQVTWSGEDGVDGSGIAGYDIYVSTDQGSNVLWKQNVTETSAVFNSQNGHTYNFSSQAIDQAGNREIPPAAAEATTTIGDLPTTITVSTSHPDGAVYGEAITFSAIVRAGGLETGVPTGSVQWWIDSAPFGPPSILSGQTLVVLTVDNLSVGTHSVVVRYTSDSPSFADSESSSLSQVVGQAVLIVSADNPWKIYGSDNPVLTGHITGLRNDDPITASFTTAATSASSVGSYPIRPVLSDSSGKLSNYRLSIVEGALNVAPAPLTIAVDSKSKSYGASLPALTASYAGFVNGDTAASLTAPLSLVTVATVVSHVGDYPITASGAVASDYAISYIQGSLTVTPAHVTINQSVDQTDPTNQAPIHFTAVFREPVSTFTAGSLALGGTAQGPLAASVNPLGSDGTTYDISVNGMQGSGTVTVGPAAGNGDLSVTTTDNTVTYRPWQNTRNPMDVNDQGGVTPLDILLLINYINAYGSGPLPAPPPSPGPPLYADVDGDGQVTPLDVLAVINYLNSQNTVGTVQPEGESALWPVRSPVASSPDWQSQVVTSDPPLTLTPAITQGPSEIPGLATPSAPQVVAPLSLARSAAVQPTTSPDIDAALQSSATSPLPSADWEILLDRLAEGGTRRGNRPDQVDQVFTELASGLD